MLKNSVIYLSSSLLNKAVPFLLLPILTKYLSPAEYGTIALLQLAFTFTMASLGLCLNVHVTRAYYALSVERFRQYLSATMAVLSGMLVLGSVGAFCAYLLLGDFLGFGEKWIFVLPVAASMSMANLIYLTLLRAKNKAISYAGWEFFSTVLNMALSLWLVVVAKEGWEGRATGMIYPFILIGLCVFPLLWRQKYLVRNVQFADVREIVTISLPLIPHAIATVMITLADRYFIKLYEGDAAVGVYSVAVQFGMVVMLFSDAFAKAWQPFFFKNMTQEGESGKRKIVKYTYAYLLFMVLLSMGYGSVLMMIYPWVVEDPQYQQARDILIPAALVYLPYAAYQIAFQYLVLTKKTHALAATTVLSSLMAVFLNFMLVPWLGIVGGVIATGSSYFMNFLLVAFIVRKDVDMPWRNWKLSS